MEKGGSGSGVAGGAGAGAGVETLGPALDAQSFPYVEEPSDEELSDYQPYRSPGAGSSASPVKITLTETPPRSPSPNAPMAVSERESILSLGLEGMPTVTLSEPEDDSPGSSTPPFPGMHTQIHTHTHCVFVYVCACLYMLINHTCVLCVNVCVFVCTVFV